MRVLACHVQETKTARDEAVKRAETAAVEVSVMREQCAAVEADANQRVERYVQTHTHTHTRTDSLKLLQGLAGMCTLAANDMAGSVMLCVHVCVCVCACCCALQASKGREETVCRER